MSQQAQTMLTLMDIKSDLKQRVHSEGYRLTPQRQMVLDAVTQAKGHCTPDQVYEQVRAKSPEVSRATVYRTLTFLLDLGLVTVGQIKDNVTVYELAGSTPHHHLVCQRCNDIYELRHEAVQPLFSRIEREFGFKVRTDHLILFGLCERCRCEDVGEC